MVSLHSWHGDYSHPHLIINPLMTHISKKKKNDRGREKRKHSLLLEANIWKFLFPLGLLYRPNWLNERCQWSMTTSPPSVSTQGFWGKSVDQIWSQSVYYTWRDAVWSWPTSFHSAWACKPGNRQESLRRVHVWVSFLLSELEDWVQTNKESLSPLAPSSSVIDQMCQTLSAAAER